MARRLFVEKLDHLYSDDESEPEQIENAQVATPTNGGEVVEAKPKPKKKSKSEEKWFLFHKYKYPSIGPSKDHDCINVASNNPKHITLSYFQ